MKVVTPIVCMAIGAVFGAVTVLSCSDNSPGKADAATCNCEPPIAGRLVTIDGNPTTLQPGEQSGAGAACPTGAQFLTGACMPVDPQTLKDIQVQQFKWDPTSFGWGCGFKNNSTTTAVQVKATVLCLKPPT